MGKRKHNSDKGKILVTGGGGYIGIVQVEELLKRGYQVKILDTFYWGKENLKHLKGKAELVQADIRQVGARVLKNISAVIHHAALSNDPMAEFNPKANFEINTQATKRFAKLCKQNGIKRFTFASSASIYDKGLLVKDVLQDESSAVTPKAAYSLSKYKAEKGLLNLADKDFCPVIFRQGTVYGFSPRMRYDLVVNTMLKDALFFNKIRVFCGGKEWRPLIDIHDIAQAHIIALEEEEEKVRGQIFNLVYKNYRILELAHWVKKALKETKKLNPKIKVDYSQRKGRSYRISGKKIKKILGWEPKISVEESVKDMLKKIEKFDYTNFNHPKYYNIEWMKIITQKIN